MRALYLQHKLICGLTGSVAITDPDTCSEEAFNTSEETKARQRDVNFGSKLDRGKSSALLETLKKLTPPAVTHRCKVFKLHPEM